ncbi:GRAM-like protein [Artemisia annua]|uniref:GRAM-like protein n=1 Tax=Artemisia annua TaxID=35608 RepID=A0A2U1LPV0_ARTAN|nr:GRAM-like protein [Artemisia annua]
MFVIEWHGSIDAGCGFVNPGLTEEVEAVEDHQVAENQHVTDENNDEEQLVNTEQENPAEAGNDPDPVYATENQAALRRSSRVPTMPTRFNDFIMGSSSRTSTLINIMIQKTLPNNFNIKHNQIIATEDQNMDHRFSSNVMGVPVKSTRGLLLSKPYQPVLTLPTSSKINGIEIKDSLVVSIKNHVSLGPKLLNIVKHKLGYGAKILPLGREGKIFSKTFGTSDCEKLVHASRCCIYTTAGAIAGTLFVSNERVSFCSDRSLKTYSTTGEVLNFQYKVSIPLGKIKGVGESLNMKRPSKKYLEFVTVDGFNFWFLSFTNYKKTLRYLYQTISHNCLSN